MKTRRVCLAEHGELVEATSSGRRVAEDADRIAHQPLELVEELEDVLAGLALVDGAHPGHEGSGPSPRSPGRRPTLGRRPGGRPRPIPGRRSGRRRSMSRRELPPRRLAPWTLTQAHSPAAKKPVDRGRAGRRRRRCRPWSSAGRAGWGSARSIGIEPGEVDADLPDPRQPLEDLLPPEVPEVEVDDTGSSNPLPLSISVWMDRATMSRGRELHGLGRVVLHEPPPLALTR